MTSCNAATACLGTTYALTASVPTVLVRSQSAVNYLDSMQYYQVVSAPPGYLISVSFSVINTEACCDPLYVFNSLTATFRTNTVPVGASVYTCAGYTGACPVSVPRLGLYGTPVVVELWTDSSVTSTGLVFTAALVACPAGSYCTTGSSAPILCPSLNYCPLGSSAPLPCMCGGCASMGLSVADSCSATPSPTPTASLSAGVSL